MNITKKTGKLVAIKAVNDEYDLMITNRNGVVIRIPADSIRVMGRATQGVRVIRMSQGDEIADVAVVMEEQSEEEE